MTVERTKQYIGPDPVGWINRLLNVNDASEFTNRQRWIIETGLNKIRSELIHGLPGLED